MTVFWLQPWAWMGLAALIVPLAVHLLARQQRLRVPFPSLRFLRTTRLSAFRRWRITDWPLLLVRLLIVGGAVAALASPVFVSTDRQHSWARRIARAVVVVTDTADKPDAAEVVRLAAEERAAAFVAREFPVSSAEIVNGIRDASMWLNRQPPASREVVIIGDVRAGTLTAGDFAMLSPQVGIRVLPVASSAPDRALQITAIGEHDGTTGVYQMHTTLDDLATRVEYGPTGPVNSTPVEVRAAPAHQHRVDAALGAVLSEGVVFPRDSGRHMIIAFEGTRSAPPRTMVRPPRPGWMRSALEGIDDVRSGEQDGVLVIEPDVTGDDSRIVSLISQVVTAAFADDRRDLEPRRVPASMLAAWARPPGSVPADVKPGDEGDRRLIWLGVLALLVFETWVRRGRSSDKPLASAAEEEAQRVA